MSKQKQHIKRQTYENQIVTIYGSKTYTFFRDWDPNKSRDPILSERYSLEPFFFPLQFFFGAVFHQHFVLEMTSFWRSPRYIFDPPPKKLDPTLARKNDAPMPNGNMHLTIYHVKVFF